MDGGNIFARRRRPHRQRQRTEPTTATTDNKTPLFRRHQAIKSLFSGNLVEIAILVQVGLFIYFIRDPI